MLFDKKHQVPGVLLTKCTLTHWGIYTSLNLVNIGSDNGLSPVRRQAIIWTNAGILSIGPLGTNVSEILIGIQTFSFKKLHLKTSSAKWRLFCLGLNVLSNHLQGRHNQEWVNRVYDIFLPSLVCMIYKHESNRGVSLRWRHNDHDSVSNHQPHGCLLNRLFRRRWKKTSKLRVTGLCAGNSPGPVNSPHKGPVTRKMFPFHDVIMWRMCLLCILLAQYPAMDVTRYQEALFTNRDYLILGYEYLTTFICHKRDIITPCLLPRIREFIHTQHRNTTRGRRPSVVLRC